MNATEREERMTRLTDKEFFCKSNNHIGYQAYQGRNFYTALKEYIGEQQKLDVVYGDLGIIDLVEEEMANRFKQAMYKLRVALEMAGNDKLDSENVIKRIEICRRGLSAMKKYAEDNKLVPRLDIWIYQVDGKKVFGVIKDKDKLKMAQSIYKDVEAIYTLRELYTMMLDYRSVHNVKKTLTEKGHTPTIEQIDKFTEEYFDDDVPF